MSLYLELVPYAYNPKAPALGGDFFDAYALKASYYAAPKIN